MTAYGASEWSDLFVATAGASAALAGLVFVAISIIGLIPGQGTSSSGSSLLAIGSLGVLACPGGGRAWEDRPKHLASSPITA